MARDKMMRLNKGVFGRPALSKAKSNYTTQTLHILKTAVDIPLIICFT